MFSGQLTTPDRFSYHTGRRWGDVGAPADGAEPPDYNLDLHTRESVIAPILDLPPRVHDHAHYSERRSMGVTGLLLVHRHRFIRLSSFLLRYRAYGLNPSE